MWIRVVQRQALGSIPLEWDSARRELYLLRLDVAQPVSVDTLVWPQERADGGCIAAFSVVHGDATDGVHSIWFPCSIEGTPRLLGYDVADDVFLSGLSNCGYTDDEKSALRPKWAPHLNKYHLFDDANIAYEFKTIADARVCEHAPFFVFGIYLLSI
jgi:hypothetical protein